MAFSGSVKRDCDKRNRRNRNLREYRRPLDASNYWKSVTGRNFIITGGTETQRNGLLLEAVRELRTACAGPIIILNGNRGFERDVIVSAKQEMLGKVAVLSPEYKNYDTFWGMQPAKIKELFLELGKKRGMADTSALGDYAEAFVEILSKKYVPSLRAMLALAKLPDEKIAAFGYSHNVNLCYLEIIKNGTEAGRYFRNLLTDFKYAFQDINGNEDTKYNIAATKSENQIYMVWVRSQFQNVFNMEIAAEIKILLARRQRFTLIVNDVIMERNDGLADVIAQAKDVSGATVGICCQNVVSWSNGSSEQQMILGNSPAMLVLNTGYEDSTDQSVVLDRFGKYMHFEPSIGVGSKPGCFHIGGYGTRQVGMINYEKPRVSNEDMQFYTVAARGHKGDIVELYTGIRNI